MEKPKYHHVDKFSFTCVSGKFRVPPVTTFQDEERSPVFIQFLDCVHQLIYQFRTAFEFDDSLLLFIAHHLYSGRFGNFISNSFKVTSHFIQGGPIMLAILVVMGNKYTCNLSQEGDQICLQSWFKRGPNMPAIFKTP